MSLEFLKRHLKQRTLKPVYLFYGEEELLLRRTLRHLETWLEKQEGVAAKYNLAPETATLAEVLALVQSPPLWTGRQLIIVWQADKLVSTSAAAETPAGSRSRAQKAAAGQFQRPLEQLAHYLEAPAPGTLLILVGLGLKEAEVRKHPLWRRLAAQEAAIYFPKLKEREISGWLMEEARRLNKILTPEAAARLLELVGPQLPELAQELEKLALYGGPEAQLTREMVEQLCGSSRSYTIFELGDALGQSQPQRALQILHRLLQLGEPPILIVTLLARQLRLLLRVQEEVEQGGAGADLARKLGVPEFVAQKLKQQAARWQPLQLLGALVQLQEADAGLKTGSLAPALLLENFILTLSQAARTAGRPRH